MLGDAWRRLETIGDDWRWLGRAGGTPGGLVGAHWGCSGAALGPAGAAVGLLWGPLELWGCCGAHWSCRGAAVGHPGFRCPVNCVAAAGEMAGRDVAMGSKVVATSAQLGHPAGNAVDGWGRFSTYWASALDPSVKAPVDLTLDFGVSVDVASIEVHWELPAKVRPRCARALL